jgi:hypothetical protein
MTTTNASTDGPWHPNTAREKAERERQQLARAQAAARAGIW